VITEMEVISM